MRKQRFKCYAAWLLSLVSWGACSGSVLAGEPRPSGGAQLPARAAQAPNGSEMPQGADLHSLVRSEWVQIVRFEAPPGAQIDVATSSGVVQLVAPAQIGLALGQIYRLRITYSDDVQKYELYPTIRLIGYTMPPAGVDPAAYPIPVHFVHRDFLDAVAGRFVSNVIYLEDPITALPVAFPPGEIPVRDVVPGEDVLARASELGRPIVFIQLGNRVPLDAAFEAGQGDPPSFWVPSYSSETTQPASGIQTVGGDTRIPLPHLRSWSSRHSTPASTSRQTVIRQPYKVHPRMPQDEYVCDGGDRVPYAHFTGEHEVAGVGVSETVAQFSRPGEPPRMVSSNEVCVYAPRFGLLRSTATSVGGLYIEGPRGVNHRVQRGAVETRVALDRRSHTDLTRSLRRGERPLRIDTQEPVAALDELRVIDAVHQEDVYLQTKSRIGSNDLSQAEELRLAKSIEAARVWTRVQYPAYTAITQSGAQITGYMQTGEIQQVREPYRKPGELVLIKRADPELARAGDEIEFVIEYHNTGSLPVESISIIDSLSARLEYVPGTAKTDRRAVFTAAPNEVESHELRWDISDPLPGRKSGVVWFKAKVR